MAANPPTDDGLARSLAAARRLTPPGTPLARYTDPHAVVLSLDTAEQLIETITNLKADLVRARADLTRPPY